MGLIENLTAENRQRLEAISTRYRSLLGFKAFEPLPAKVLAEYFSAKIFTAETVPNTKPEQVKLLCASDNWSAGIIRKKPLWIVHNSRHAPARHESNLIHEFAHVILKHKMVGYDPETALPLRRQRDEDEAVYLGGCLQIPRRGLLWAIQKQMTTTETSIHFGASEAMVSFRSNVTGVNI